MTTPIKKLHHAAYRCRSSEETRRFYEDFLGLRFVNAFVINETKSGRATSTLHTFYALADDSCLAFFEAPDLDFDFKEQRDFDLHTALEIDESALAPMIEKARALGIETRGPVDHGFITSVYFRDPNGYVVELAVNAAIDPSVIDRERNAARGRLAEWTQRRAG